MAHENVQYTLQPHTDGEALIRRANELLSRWVELYGEHNPQWLPPAGIVNWQEDAASYLALRPSAISICSLPLRSVTNWRFGPQGHGVRVCEIGDVECSRGCGIGPCARETKAAAEGSTHV